MLFRSARMRRVNEIKLEVLSRAGRYKEVYPEGQLSKDPSPLKVKEVSVDNRRYIICFNSKQARKDAADRQAIIESLKEKLRQGPKSLVGNKGYRKYLKINRGQISIDQKKLEDEARFDGKWVLKTNMDLPAQEVALKYKELWQVEHVFRDVKSVLETRPVFHQEMKQSGAMCFAAFWLLFSERNWIDVLRRLAIILNGRILNRI